MTLPAIARSPCRRQRKRPIDEHSADAGGLTPEPLRVAGEIEHQLDVGGPDRLGIEHDDVGMPTLGDPASLGEAEQAGRYVGEVTNGVLHRRELTAAQTVGQPGGGVRRSGHAIEMGAGVRTADHHVGVFPRLGPETPRLGVVVGRQRPPDGLEVVVEGDLDHRVEGPLARSRAISPSVRPLRPSLASE